MFNTAMPARFIVASSITRNIGPIAMNEFFSMAAFALATSISPGPVNMVALSTGARYGIAAGLRYVTGATCGFTLLLLATGFGLHALLDRMPWMTGLIRWAGIAFLLFLAYRLAWDKMAAGRQLPVAATAQQRPSFMHGALMQWLNPKAWLASLAGMGAYAVDGNSGLVWLFAAIYFVVCYASLACWAYAGSFLQGALLEPKRMLIFNRVMAALLAASALYLLLA